jgi:hypothetical protein
MRLTGRCVCGRVNYGINDAPLFTQACHCTDCQRTTGSAFVVHLVLVEGNFEIEGDTQSATVPTGSGAGCDLHFCTECGAYIWCRYLYHRVPVIAVRGGTLDDTNAVRPQTRIFTRSMQSWFLLPEDVPSFAEGCDRSEVWPPESLKKYDVLARSGRH